MSNLKSDSDQIIFKEWCYTRYLRQLGFPKMCFSEMASKLDMAILFYLKIYIYFCIIY